MRIILKWRKREPDANDQEDYKKCTEEGAEAISLAIAANEAGWRVRRRLQSGGNERGDWLVVDASGRQHVLEVSGTQEGNLEALFRRKIQQARESVHADVCPAAASVVRFEEPAIIFRSDDEPR